MISEITQVNDAYSERSELNLPQEHLSVGVKAS